MSETFSEIFQGITQYATQSHYKVSLPIMGACEMGTIRCYITQYDTIDPQHLLQGTQQALKLSLPPFRYNGVKKIMGVKQEYEKDAS